MILVDPALQVSIGLKVFELCLSSPQSHLFLLCFEIAKPIGIGSEPCFTVGVVGGFGIEGGDHFCMAYAVPTGRNAGPCSCIHGKVLHTAVLCVRMCTCCAYVYVCVLYLCVYVALCPFMFVFDGVFGFFW